LFVHLTLSADVDLVGVGGSGAATLSGGDAGTVIQLSSAISAIQGLTIEHGFAENGGGIRAESSELSLREVVLLTGFGDVGYCGSNTIHWHEPTDTFLYSLYSHNTIFDLDHATGDPLRVFGQDNDAWAFDPPDSAFWWQHGGYYTDAGTLLTSSYRADGDDELVVREYELDEDLQILREIWNYGVDGGIHAEYMGEAHRLPGGNTLHNYGSTPRLREVMPDGTVGWDVVWGEADGEWELGRTTPIADLYALAP